MFTKTDSLVLWKKVTKKKGRVGTLSRNLKLWCHGTRSHLSSHREGPPLSWGRTFPLLWKRVYQRETNRSRKRNSFSLLPYEEPTDDLDRKEQSKRVSSSETRDPPKGPPSSCCQGIRPRTVRKGKLVTVSDVKRPH